MAEQKNTHLAVHSIGYVDEKKNRQEIKAGTQFRAADYGDLLDTKNLEARGAVRKLAREERAAENEVSDAEKSAAAAAAGNKTFTK